MAKIPDIAEPGTLIVGATDSSGQQYTDNGRQLSAPVVHEGGRLFTIYERHAKAHGTKIANSPIPTVVAKKGVKAKLSPTSKAPAVIDAPQAEPTPISVTKYTEERNKYTAIFKIPTGTLKVDMLDFIYSEDKNAVIFIYRDADAITYTPIAGDVFEVACVDKLTKTTVNLRVFSPNFIFNLPGSDKVMLVLALDNSTDVG